ncbi:MAG TPA: 4a-hydroxytetrahydrobiopterin dehydratase [Terriglobales bacterium]|nr:4a-hydroxytetrahydrobiopterin dehydratase [Terriglobales bacterium]
METKVPGNVPDGWSVVDGHHLRREFSFPDFAAALAFVNQVGAIAEAKQHHPDICLGWGRAEITTYTHTSNGITGKDVALATEINRLI